MKKYYKSMPEIIDEALGYVSDFNLSNEEIKYLIKSIAQKVFKEDVNQELRRFKMEIKDEDKAGIKKADEFMADFFEELFIKDEPFDGKSLERIKSKLHARRTS